MRPASSASRLHARSAMPTIAPLPRAAGRAPRDRMGAAHLRHHRRAEDGRAHARRPHRRDHGATPRTTARWCGARSTTSAATAGCRSSSARVLGGGSLVLSSADEPVADHLARLGRAWRHPYLRHAVALAARADEPGGARDRAALRAAVGRDRRPGDPRQSARRLSAARASATPMPRPRRASASRSTTGCEGFPASLHRRLPSGVEMKVEDGSLRIRSPRTALALCRRRRGGARRRGRLRRHRRHRGAARRPLLFRRPARRHHQCRRPQGPSRGGRGGDQPPSAGAHVAGAGAQEPDHRRDRGRRRGAARATARPTAAASVEQRDPARCAATALPPHKVPAAIRFVPALDGRRQPASWRAAR